MEIAGNRELCEQYMGKFPVISVTLKGVEFINYETARAALCSVVGGEALHFQFLAESERLSEQERKQYCSLVKVGQPGNLDRLSIALSKGRREQIKIFAAAHGESVNAFISRAIEETMKRGGWISPD